MANLAPIVLFTYARPGHTRRTLESLARNPEAADSRLVIYSDAPRADADLDEIWRVKQVREIIRERAWCGNVEIVEAESNRGLADSIRHGVTEVVEEYGKVVVLEDDIEVSGGFLHYMNASLGLHRNQKSVWSICGYVPRSMVRPPGADTFFLRYMGCWGWATWRDRWVQACWDPVELLSRIRERGLESRFNFGAGRGFSGQLEANASGATKTWAVMWYASIFLRKGLCQFPRQSLVLNLGTDGSGENFRSDDSSTYHVDLAERIDVRPVAVRESWRARRAMKRFFRHGPDASFGDIAALKAGRAKHRLHQLIFGKPSSPQG